MNNTPRFVLNRFTINNIRILFLLLFLILSGFNSVAQKAYFQQGCEYEIAVRLNDKSNFLNGTISIRYTNNSSDTLSNIWMHVWPNAYKDRNTALSKQLLENGSTSMYFAEKLDRGYIDSLDFEINGSKVVVDYDKQNPDICNLALANPLQPGETVTITTPFRVKIPTGNFSRFGYIGESYFITQWFPKPAVYDLNGWNQMPYLNQGEFYSEFRSFKVEITLPENYVVAASGVLQDTSEINWLNEKARATSQTMAFGENDSFPPSSKQLKTISFYQDSIHDFAWFADKRFHVLKGEVELPESKRKVTTWAYFTNQNQAIWKNSISYINAAIKFYSNQIGEYPYSQYIGVDGTVTAGGGMEYPMLTVINSTGSDFTLDDVLAHEIGHSWFYGILGFNERRHGWMDEGITTFYELAYVENQYPGPAGIGKNDFGSFGFFGAATGLNSMKMKEGFQLTYKMSAFNNSDQPATTNSIDFTEFNYGAVMYYKTALAFDYLESYLGKELFRQCMKSFYEKWKFKHPGPVELQAEFELISGKNLNWFFKDLLATNTPVRYSIENVTCSGDTCAITVINKDGITAPFYIRSNESDKIWYEGFKGEQVVSFSTKNQESFWINDAYATLLKSSSKQFKPGSLLNYGKKIQIKTIPQINEKAGIQNLYLLPAVGWNRYNQWMGGLYFSNIEFIPQHFEFSLTPLYDFKNSDLAGMASFDYHIWPLKGIFSELTFSLKGKRFAYDNIYDATDFDQVIGAYNYSKIDPSITFKFRKNSPRSKITHTLALRSINLWEEFYEYMLTDSIYKKSAVTNFLNFNEITYSIQNKRVLDPYKSNIRLEQGKDHLKLALEFNYRFSYAKRNKGIDLRLFAGGFIVESKANYNFRMSGWQGYQDYLYDEIYFGRSDDHGFWDNQFMIRDGGFKIPTFVGQSNKWLAALNISVDLPLPLPISFFADIGTYEGINKVFPELNNSLMYDGGIALKLFREVLEVYVPLFNSEDIQKSLDTNDIKFFDKVRFVFNLNRIAPIRVRNSLLQSYQ
ncbi:MAG: M1 family metallopeptidase [Bacteroidetes bacterium]|nr:M1 family metallopeptidase [Bacteroidota bacterium]